MNAWQIELMQWIKFKKLQQMITTQKWTKMKEKQSFHGKPWTSFEQVVKRKLVAGKNVLPYHNNPTPLTAIQQLNWRESVNRRWRFWPRIRRWGACDSWRTNRRRRLGSVCARWAVSSRTRGLCCGSPLCFCVSLRSTRSSNSQNSFICHWTVVCEY